MCALPVQLRHKFLCPISALTDRGGRLGQGTREGSERRLSVCQRGCTRRAASSRAAPCAFLTPSRAEQEEGKYLIKGSGGLACLTAASIPPEETCSRPPA